jgi:hypothetical protein
MKDLSWKKAWAALVSTGLMTCLALAGGQQDVPPTQVPPAPEPFEAQGQAPADENGVEVQARGPVHEAFAAPVVFDPKPGFVVPKEPPAPIEEVPPDQKPQGKNVQWIGGYWAWDDDRTDFLWVSGFWRELPPGRQWVPGYWTAANGGWQWTSGYWASAEGGTVRYLPQPPASVDNGPNVPQPSGDANWVPGNWLWQEQHYIWRPGYWIVPPPQWVWVPSYYAWSPGGYVYVQGYWDYPIVDRGLLFAPAYVSPVVYARPGFVFVPAVTLVAAALTQALFCRPTYGHYYFGDYYATTYIGAGFIPFGGITNVNVTNINITNVNVYRGRVYDPIYVHERVVQRVRDPGWEQRVRNEYRHRVEHAEARPPRTFASVQKTAAQGGAAGKPVQVEHLAAVARDPAASARLERVDQAHRAEQAKQAAEARSLAERRKQAEGAARVQAVSTKEARPQSGPAPKVPRFDLPKSAVATANLNKGADRTAQGDPSKGAMEKAARDARPDRGPPAPSAAPHAVNPADGLNHASPGGPAQGAVEKRALSGPPGGGPISNDQPRANGPNLKQGGPGQDQAIRKKADVPPDFRQPQPRTEQPPRGGPARVESLPSNPGGMMRREQPPAAGPRIERRPDMPPPRSESKPEATKKKGGHG